MKEFYFRLGLLTIIIVLFLIRSFFTRHYGFNWKMSIKYIIILVLFLPYILGFFTFADLMLNLRVRFFIGGLLIISGGGLFFWSHSYLGKNWGPGLEKNFSKKTFVKKGPYKYIRHPTYSASFIFVIGLGLLGDNGIILLVPLLFLIVFYLYKIPKEEEEYLLMNFGREYRDYMKKVNRFVPKISL